MTTYYLINLVVFIHVMAAMMWVGGMLFIAIVVIPALKNFEPPQKRIEVISATATRFKKIGWISIGILFVTGLINIANHGVTHKMIFSDSFLSTHFGKVLIIKLTLFLIMVLLSASHDFILGPKHIKLLERPKSDAEAQSEIAKNKKLVSWLARVNVIVVVMIVACAVMLS